ncbi:MAG: succinylglutamate desuccinylase/aspartoacylase family protein [Bdellovibrionota bacterium]|nr:succinylglutamate desuccinylase/aspartoacylase family protein [Bdellovibrionota bacterium]
MKNVINIKQKEDFKLSALKKGELHRFSLHLSDNSLGVPWRVPVIVIKGEKKGPTFGITAAVHGDELNGISTIFKLIENIDPKKLAGTLVLVPISNVPGYLANQRYFSDHADLNRIMPGAPEGKASDIYAHQFTQKIVKKFDYLLDLHTASHGRVNSLYIRADLDNDQTKELAYLQNPQIIVQKFDENGTLRGWANDHGIPSITIEIGNPNAFQHNLIDETLDGILNTLRHYKMVKGEVRPLVTDAVICEKSYWIYSKRGGIIDVFPQLTDRVRRGEVIAKVYDVFGQVKEEVVANRSGIVIGKNVRPNCDAGTRVLHLGVLLSDIDEQEFNEIL